jgi:hypothetical protein
MSAPDIIPMEAPEEMVNTRPAPILTRLNETLALSVQKQLNRAEINRAVDIRPPATAILTINSADRYKSFAARYNNPGNSNANQLTSPADFVLNIGQNLMNGNFTRLAVTQVQINYTWPNVCPATNGIYLNWQPGGTGAVTQYLISFSPNTTYTYGPVNINSVQSTTLQAIIRAATGSSTFTVTYGSAQVNLLSFASGNTDKFYFSRWTSTTGPNAYTLMEFFGFSAVQVLATTQLGGMKATPARTQFVDVVCEPITSNQLLRDASTTPNSKTLLTRIYTQAENQISQNITNGSGIYSLQKTYTLPKQIAWPANQPIAGNLRFQLLDDQGYVLTCGASNNDAFGNLGPFNDVNMGDWSLTLQVSEQ